MSGEKQTAGKDSPGYSRPTAITGTWSGIERTAEWAYRFRPADEAGGTSFDLAEAVLVLLDAANRDRERARTAEAALRACTAAAGNPDAAEGCRQVIRIVKEAVGDDIPF